MSIIPDTNTRGLYLELLKRCLLDNLYGEEEFKLIKHGGRLFNWVNKYLQSKGMAAVKRIKIRNDSRIEGRDWPARALSMTGVKRLDSLQDCVEGVLQRGIPGDFIETGVWRGGSVILMRAILKIYNDASRTVWVADSFQGLPPPNPELYPADKGDDLHTFEELGVSLEEVAKNFERFGLLDERVKFLKGWFKDTLPTAPIDKLALIRLDGDMYESTMDALKALYPKLSPGGVLIVDDYGCIAACKQAVHDYRAEHKIEDPIQSIDWSGVFWVRGS